MTDREKVIKGLEEISDYFFNVYHRSKDREEINNAKDRCDAVEDALALLKEQEEIKPKQVGLYGKDDWYGLVCVCPDCKAEWMSDESETHFCPNCGQEVKWE